MPKQLLIFYITPGWQLHERLISYVCFMDPHPANAPGTQAGSQLPAPQEQLESWRENWKYINYQPWTRMLIQDKTDVPLA